MQQIYRARISRIGNSKGVRLPKEMVLSLGSTDVILESTPEGILIKPAPKIPPLSQWDELFKKANVEPESEFDAWDITLNDGDYEENI